MGKNEHFEAGDRWVSSYSFINTLLSILRDRNDKKAFFNEQSKEIQENNRRKTGNTGKQQKTRYLFKKTGEIKGTYHAKMGIIKDRNGKDLIVAEEIKKRWQEYIEELCKKYLNDLDNHNGVVTHLETDILKCEVKGALGSTYANKASGGDGIAAELFKILKK